MRYVSDGNSTCYLYESGLYASTSGTGQWIGLVQSCDPDENKNIKSVRYHGQNTRNVGVFVDGALDFGGKFSYYAQDFKMLGFALGSIVYAGSPSPYTHVASEVNTGTNNVMTSGTNCPFISFTLETAQKGAAAGEHFIRTFKGCMVDSISIAGTMGEPITIDVNWVSKEGLFTSGTVTSATADTTRPYLWSDVKLWIPSGTANMITDLKSLTYTLNNNLMKEHYLNGSRQISIPIPVNRDHELSVSMDASNAWAKTMYEQYLQGGVGSQFNVLLEINASAGSKDAFLALSGCVMMDVSAPMPNDGVNEFSLTIKPTSASLSTNDLIFKWNAF